MSGLCRICMFPKFDLINLVKDGTDTLERSGEKFEDCFGIKVKELPYCQRICKDCDKQLIDFYYFKQQALRTHNYMIDKAYDLQPSWPGVKEDMDVTDVEIIDDTPTIKQEKNHIEYTEDTLSEVLDSYKQIAPLMYEVANESISEDKIEMEGVALNTKDNEGEVDKVDKMIKDYTYCRRIWGERETIAFLRAYGARKDEFLHSRKKKIAMQNVLKDLTAQNLLDQPTTVDLLNNKLKNLLRTYKFAKDNVKSAPPSFAPFDGRNIWRNAYSFERSHVKFMRRASTSSRNFTGINLSENFATACNAR